MIEVERAKLKEALELVATVARPDAANPVLQTVTIITEKDRLIFEAQSEFEVVRTSCESKLTGDAGKLARFAIRPASLLARIGTVHVDTVRIDAEKKTDGFAVRVRAGTACWRIEPFDPGPFPDDLPTELRPIDGEAFAKAFSRVLWAVCNDSSRPQFHGIIVVPKRDGVGYAFSTDGNAIARVRLDHEETSPFIAPLCLAKMLSSKGASVRSLGITSRYIAIEFGNSLYASRRPAAEPGAVETVFGMKLGIDQVYECRVVAKDLAGAIVAATVGGKESKEVDIENIGGDFIVRTPSGDTATAKCEGDAPSMTVRVDQIKDALSGCSEPVAILKRAKDPTEPLFVHQEDGSYVALLVPVIQKEAESPKAKKEAA